jgi:hypothetical protein
MILYKGQRRSKKKVEERKILKWWNFFPGNGESKLNMKD